MNLSKDIKITVASGSTVAGTTTVTSSVIDMQGYEGIIWYVQTGDATSGTVLTLTAKENTANSTSVPTPTSITGGSATYTSSTASDADDKGLLVDIFRPQKRYQYCTLTRATQNCVVNGILAIQYKAGKKPTTNDTSVLATTFVVGNG